MTDRKIGAAILGIGEMGKVHVQAAKDSPYVNKVIGFEPDADRGRVRGKELGIAVTNQLDTILGDKDIHLVFIASPNKYHCEQTIQCLKAGKAVLCEKPMGLSLGEARKMIAVQQQTNGYLQIGFELRFSKMYTLVKNWIDQGLIGTPLNTIFNYYCSEFHLKNTWRSSNTGCFLIGEKLSHYLDLPRWWIGSSVKEVYSVCAPNFVDYFNHADNHCIVYKFENGAASSLNFVMGTAETCTSDPLQDLLPKQSEDGHSLKYLIYGKKGAIETDVFNRRVRRWEFKDAPDRLSSKIVEVISYPGCEDQQWMHNVYGQNLEVAKAVALGQKPLVDPQDAFATMQLVFAAEASAITGKIVNPSEL